MNFNSCLNFQISKRIGVFAQYICDVNLCNEWKTEKRHESTNMGKVLKTRIMKAKVRHVTSGEERTRYQAS
jgi:hypothetical protein